MGVGSFLFVMVPLACALFPQTAEITADTLRYSNLFYAVSANCSDHCKLSFNITYFFFLFLETKIQKPMKSYRKDIHPVIKFHLYFIIIKVYNIKIFFFFFSTLYLIQHLGEKNNHKS